MEEKAKQETTVNLEVLQQKATKFFEEKPKALKVFGTSDEYLFTNKKNAINHSLTLEDQQVYDFKNPARIKVVDEETISEESEK